MLPLYTYTCMYAWEKVTKLMLGLGSTFWPRCSLLPRSAVTLRVLVAISHKASLDELQIDAHRRHIFWLDGLCTYAPVRSHISRGESLFLTIPAYEVDHYTRRCAFQTSFAIIEVRPKDATTKFIGYCISSNRLSLRLDITIADGKVVRSGEP